MNEIARLTELCEQWGGKLRILAPEAFNKIFPKIGEPGWQDWGARGKHHAPFSPNLGVNWKRKIVYAMVDSDRFKEPFWPRIIHEMAHNHASRVYAIAWFSKPSEAGAFIQEPIRTVPTRPFAERYEEVVKRNEELTVENTKLKLELSKRDPYR